MTFDTLTFSLPAHWMPGLVNGDVTGLDDAEAAALQRFETDQHREFGHVIYDCADDTYFERWHDAAEYGVLACDCYDVTIMFEPADVMEAA